MALPKPVLILSGDPKPVLMQRSDPPAAANPKVARISGSAHLGLGMPPHR